MAFVPPSRPTRTQALHSLFRNAHVAHMKRHSHAVRSQTMRHVKSYLNGASPLTLARRCNYPPSMMARLVVENVAASPSSRPREETKGERGAAPHDGKDGNGSNNNCTNNDSNRGVSNSNGRRGDGSTINNSNSNNNPSNRGGGNNNSSSTAKKKFVTEALRYPEKTLGYASLSVLPEYLFSEKNGSGRLPMDEGSGKPSRDDDDELPLLSRLSLEVREAIDADPMYGESCILLQLLPRERWGHCVHRQISSSDFRPRSSQC